MTASSKKTNRFALVAAGAALLGLCGNLAILAVLFVSPALFFGMSIDNIFFTGFTCMCSVALGIETVVKFRWPGTTVPDRAKKPSGKDLVLVLASFILTGVNVAACLGFIGLAQMMAG